MVSGRGEFGLFLVGFILSQRRGVSQETVIAKEAKLG